MSLRAPDSHRGLFALGLGWLFSVVLAVLTVAGIVAVLVYGFRWVTAEPRGALQAREQIQSGAMRITAYNHFYGLCAAVQALEDGLAAQLEQLPHAVDRGDEARIRQNVVALRAQRARSIRTYNADARKSWTIGQFRASDLPYQLPIEGRTSCSA